MIEIKYNPKKYYHVFEGFSLTEEQKIEALSQLSKWIALSIESSIRCRSPELLDEHIVLDLDKLEDTRDFKDFDWAWDKQLKEIKDKEKKELQTKQAET